MKLCGRLQCRHELQWHGYQGCTVKDCSCEAFGDFEPTYPKVARDHQRGGKSVDAILEAVGAALAGKTVLLVMGAGSVRIEPVKLKEQLADIRIDEMIVNDGANGSGWIDEAGLFTEEALRSIIETNKKTFGKTTTSESETKA